MRNILQNYFRKCFIIFWKYFGRRFAPPKTFPKFAENLKTIPLPSSPNKTLYSPLAHWSQEARRRFKAYPWLQKSWPEGMNLFLLIKRVPNLHKNNLIKWTYFCRKFSVFIYSLQIRSYRISIPSCANLAFLVEVIIPWLLEPCNLQRTVS